MAGAKKRGRNGEPTPGGSLFMKGTHTSDIRAPLRAERGSGGNAKAVLVWLACLWRRDGRSGLKIARDLDRPTSTVYAWLSRMHLHGLGGRHDKPKPGRPRIISPDRHGEISGLVDGQPNGCGMKSSVWTCRLLLIMVTNVLGIREISRSTIYRTMHRMNKSHRKPGRPFDHRTPSYEIKKEFKTALAQDISKMVAVGFHILWIDEAHFTTKTKRGLTWLARGLFTMHRIKPFGKSCTCFAALGAGGLFCHQYHDRGNTDNMVQFIQGIYETYGRVLLVMDNASYHRSKDLMKHIEEYGGDVCIVCQPPYSPDLNPVEMVWKELKKYIANGTYRRVDDMTGAIDDMMQDGTVMMSTLPEYALDAIRQGQAAA